MVPISHLSQPAVRLKLKHVLLSTAFHFAAVLPDPDDTVNVTHVQLKVNLCCLAKQDCEPCLQIIITFHGLSCPVCHIMHFPYRSKHLHQHRCLLHSYHSC